MSHSSITGIIIPYYNAAAQIIRVLEKAAVYSEHIVIVNDCSPQPLPLELLQKFKHVTVINNTRNLGVGGATLKGIIFFLDNPTVRILVKLDADDQMDTTFIPQLIDPIIKNQAQFVKGNRFRDFRALRQMPWIRRFGNLFLSFLSKIATGYWNCFDFNNGFFAISVNTSSKLMTQNIAHNYFFETSLIGELYYQKAHIKEIPMPAIYGSEISSMNIARMPFLFMVNLLKMFVLRIWKSYFVYDFNIGSVYIFFGIPLFFSGIIFGGYNWYIHASLNELTPTGTIMISALLIIVGFQLLLQAIQFDILRTPGSPRDNQ